MPFWAWQPTCFGKESLLLYLKCNFALMLLSLCVFAQCSFSSVTWVVSIQDNVSVMPLYFRI